MHVESCNDYAGYISFVFSGSKTSNRNFRMTNKENAHAACVIAVILGVSKQKMANSTEIVPT